MNPFIVFALLVGFLAIIGVRLPSRSRHNTKVHFKTKAGKRVAIKAFKTAPDPARGEVQSALRNLGYNRATAKAKADQARGGDFDSMLRDAMRLK